MASDVKRKRFEFGPGDKEVCRKFLLHRLAGVERAIESLEAARRHDPTSFSANNLAYYENVRSYLLQAIGQVAVGKESAIDNANPQL